MEINELEAGMLDTVLEAFAGRKELDWTQLLELFDGDEELAAAITDILAGMGLVTKNGGESSIGLPEKIIRRDEAISFMEKGGFTAQIIVAQPTEMPIAAASKQTREVIFEIEIPRTEETESARRKAEVAEDFESPVATEILSAEAARPANVFGIPGMAELPQSEAAEVIGLHLPAAEPLTDAGSEEQYQQQIVQLHGELARSEHKLREKDAMIHTLASHNEQLGRFRLFIWALLVLITLFVAGLIFRAH